MEGAKWLSAIKLGNPPPSLFSISGGSQILSAGWGICTKKMVVPSLKVL